MLIRHQISLFIITFLIVGFFILALPEKGFSGTPDLGCCKPPEGPCFETDQEGCSQADGMPFANPCAEVPECAPPCSIEIVKIALRTTRPLNLRFYRAAKTSHSWTRRNNHLHSF